MNAAEVYVQCPHCGHRAIVADIGQRVQVIACPTCHRDRQFERRDAA